MIKPQDMKHCAISFFCFFLDLLCFDVLCPLFCSVCECACMNILQGLQYEKQELD